MTDGGFWVWVFGFVLVAVLLWPGVGLLAQLQRRRTFRRRELYEDALKHILTWERRGQDATPESLAGALGMSPDGVLQVVTRLESKGLLESQAGGLRLTPEGERWALQVVRAHRLWERYLSDDAGMPMERLHPAAEKAEHHFNAEALDALEAHLGHPQRDPHGDPIPRADGSLPAVKAVPLTDWPADRAARVVHIEDEPDAIFKQILATGVRPGTTIRILESDANRLIISDGENEHRLARVVASNIQVAPYVPREERPAGAKRLSELAQGEQAELLEIDADCRGFSRRRLLDLGMTPKTRIEVTLDNTFGDPRAFRLRGTTIALRTAQADHIWVLPLRKQPEAAEPVGATKA